MSKACKSIGLNNIEELLLLADDVIKQLYHSYEFYDENGYSAYQVCRQDDGKIDYEKARLLTKEQRENEDDKMLLYSIVKNPKEDFNKVINYSSEELLEEKLQPLLKKAIGIFRNGAEHDTVMNDTNYCVDDSVSDDYLKTLFAMRVRDLMIVNACQRFEKSYYFLLWGCDCCHDMDSWIGVYHDLANLRKAYNHTLKHDTEFITVEELQIYKFTEKQPGYVRVFPEDLWEK